METLPDDVVVEILVRVTDVAALFRCAATCKRCRLLITEPSFLRRRWPEGVSHPSSLLGFFAAQQPRDREEPTEGSSTATPMPLFTPVPWYSRLGEHHGFLAFPCPPGTQAAELIASRGGLVVGRIIPHDDPSPSGWHASTMILLVYDPLTGKSRRLPELKTNRPFRIQGCAVLTSADCCPARRRGSVRPSFFKVLIIGADRDEPRHNLHVFTSTEPSWSTPRECFDPSEHGGTRLVSQEIRGVVCQGVAHWLLMNTSTSYVLSVCATTTEMSLTRLPVTSSHQTRPLLGATNDGAPSLLCLDEKCTMLEIWTRSSDNMSNTGRWRRTKMIELRPPERGKIDQAQCVCVGETSGKLLVKDNHQQQDLYIVDLQTGAVEAVTDWFRGSVLMAIPFEMDWPAFFARRLANTRIKRNKLRGAISKIARSLWEPMVVSIILGSIAISRYY